MIAVDTNVIVRLVTRDHEAQFKKAYAVFKKHDVFIPDTVILETEWVLRYAYKFKPADISTAFGKLCGLANVRLSNPNTIARIIEWYQQGVDFADAFHLAGSQSCRQLLTFDARFIKRAKHLGECEVSRP